MPDKNEKTIYDLGLHEVFKISKYKYITRVPGGWIYAFISFENYKKQDYFNTVFVPYSTEFRPPIVLEEETQKITVTKFFDLYKNEMSRILFNSLVQYIERYPNNYERRYLFFDPSKTEIIKITDEDILRIPGIGKKTLSEFRRLIDKFLKSKI